MATAGDRAFATVLTYTTGAKVVGEITSISGPELTADTIEMTNHSTSTSRFREFIQGLRDGGTMTLTGNHVPADTGQVQIPAHFAAGDAEAMTIVFPDGSQWAFSAICTAYKPSDAPVDGKLEFTASFKITGVPTFTGT